MACHGVWNLYFLGLRPWKYITPSDVQIPYTMTSHGTTNTLYVKMAAKTLYSTLTYIHLAAVSFTVVKHTIHYLKRSNNEVCVEHNIIAQKVPSYSNVT